MLSRTGMQWFINVAGSQGDVVQISAALDHIERKMAEVHREPATIPAILSLHDVEDVELEDQEHDEFH